MDGTGCFAVEVSRDTAKFTNVRIARSLIPYLHNYTPERSDQAS